MANLTKAIRTGKGGSFMGIEFTNRSGTIANIYAADEAMQRAVKKSVEDIGKKATAETKKTAPVSKEGSYIGAGRKRLKRSIKLRLSEKGLAWEVYADPSLYKPEPDLRYPNQMYNGRYYAPYVEARTGFMTSAWAKYNQVTKSEISKQIRIALKRSSRNVL
jgi:hypothetical protein